MDNNTASDLNNASIFPQKFVQTGVEIDVEITTRLTRSLWRALGESDLTARVRLNAFLQEEIDGLELQHEIDVGGAGDIGATSGSLAVAQLLKQYLLPIDSISGSMPV